MSAQLICLFRCVSAMRHIESLGQANDTTGRKEFGWSAADAYEDARGWAQYHAGQIIGGHCECCGERNGGHAYLCAAKDRATQPTAALAAPTDTGSTSS